jgi:Acyl-coenzyme A:6-aminopenicillanic acid acyl-transferase
MLFHFDEIIANVTEQKKSELESNGCSTVYVKNANEHILGHTEDAARECLNSFYLVSAHILADPTKGFREEKFTALCYPGHIAGYTMGYNTSGLV